MNDFLNFIEKDIATKKTQIQTLPIKTKTNIKKYEQLGRKKLAYKVKDNENGFFITFNYLLTNEELEEIQKRARTDEKIIKFINTL